ncbi:MAG TPA: Gfo/Idh/MocA family oxidoreductase [Bryobacteraceae bacterium]|nr:Gfo/Idh/MocA family oxidoreductase [Bryobacteraceae bacterium]
MKALVFLLAFGAATAADLRIGIIGTDTSHATAFTKVLHESSGVRVVAAFKGGSPDVESSRTRVDKFADELRKSYGVEIVPDIPALLAKVDAVLLLSVDGRTHLSQARQVIAARKPMFIDKPLASTLEDAREIARLARTAGVPWFSSSSLRFGPFADSLKAADVTGAVVWGPGPTEEHHELELTWYGIHSVELLYTVMGSGCENVSMVSGKDADIVTGRWKDGRVGAVRLIRPYSDFGATVFRAKAIIQSDPKLAKVDYRPTLVRIVEFFRTGKPPVEEAETLEIFAFMDAAQRSKAANGATQPLR